MCAPKVCWGVFFVCFYLFISKQSTQAYNHALKVTSKHFQSQPSCPTFVWVELIFLLVAAGAVFWI